MANQDSEDEFELDNNGDMYNYPSNNSETEENRDFDYDNDDLYDIEHIEILFLDTPEANNANDFVEPEPE